MKQEPIWWMLLTHTAENSIANCLGLSSQKRQTWFWKPQGRLPSLLWTEAAEVASALRWQLCTGGRNLAVWAMIAVNQQLPLLREMQQAQWRCPVGKAEVWDEPVLSCANLKPGDRKKGDVLLPSGVKHREPEQLVQCQSGLEYQSWECNSCFQEVISLY